MQEMNFLRTAYIVWCLPFVRFLNIIIKNVSCKTTTKLWRYSILHFFFNYRLRFFCDMLIDCIILLYNYKLCLWILFWKMSEAKTVTLNWSKYAYWWRIYLHYLTRTHTHTHKTIECWRKLRFDDRHHHHTLYLYILFFAREFKAKMA